MMESKFGRFNRKAMAVTIRNTIAYERGELLSYRTPKNVDDRRARRYEGPIGKLNRWVDDLWARTGESIPYFDPDAAKQGARILMLLQDPSTAADGESGFISLHNNDFTARNVYRSCIASSLSYGDYLPWNVVPWRVGDRDLESEARRALPFLLEFLELLDPAPEVVILVGDKAQAAWRAAGVGQAGSRFAHLEPPLRCPHPTPRNYDEINRRTGRLTSDLVTETFAAAAARIAPNAAPTTESRPSAAPSRESIDANPWAEPAHRRVRSPEMASGPPPTAEQAEIYELFKAGGALRIRAGAGTGKTTTLLQLAEILGTEDRLGLYLAFNKSVAAEAKRKFPRHVTCLTSHSLANRGIRGTPNAELLAKLEGGRVPLARVQEHLGIRPATVTGFNGRPHRISAYQLAQHAVRTIDAFCKSADDTIALHHVPRMPGIDEQGYGRLIDVVLPYALEGWADLTNLDGNALTFGHSHYLKLWALGHPRIGREGDALFLDEAQDTSPVLAGVLAEQHHLQRVVVGDSAQAIYGFTGAKSFMTDERMPGSVEARLTQSWRFGQDIAEQANQLLARLGDDLRLSGNPGLRSRVDRALADPDAILTRTNGCAIGHVMRAQLVGRRVHLFGDTAFAVAFCNGAERLQNGLDASTAELAAFTSWDEVVEYAFESPDGADWKVLVKLIDTHGLHALRRALDRTVPEAGADLIVSTTHKSKGREWGRVLLDDELADAVDAAADGGNRAQLRDELMLGYVAVTRAKDTLNPGRLTRQPASTRLASEINRGKHVASDRFMDALDRMEGIGTRDELIAYVIDHEQLDDTVEVWQLLADEIDRLDEDPRVTWKWFGGDWVAAGGRNPVDAGGRAAQLDTFEAVFNTLGPETSTGKLADAAAGTAVSHISTQRLAQMWEELVFEAGLESSEHPSYSSSTEEADVPRRSDGSSGPEFVGDSRDRDPPDDEVGHSKDETDRRNSASRRVWVRVQAAGRRYGTVVRQRRRQR
jgi:hypothetical protein